MEKPKFSVRKYWSEEDGAASIEYALLVAAIAIVERDNPRRLEATLNGLLAPEDRAERFD